MKTPHILLLEDEGALARAVTRRLRHDGYTVAACDSLASARQAAQDRVPDLAVLDLRLPDGHGLEFLAWLQAELVPIPAIVMTAFGELDDAIDAMRLGVVDFLKKPLDLEALCRVVSDGLHRDAFATAANASDKPAPGRAPALIGDSEAMVVLNAQVERIAALGTGTAPPNVLITGETGTGKDLLARAVHARSPRANTQFVQVDCAALPHDLIEAELFGHQKGAFTHADRARRGLLAAAGDGTAFLNEIAELPRALQAKLLTALESRTAREIGSDTEHTINAWFIAATNRDMATMMADGDFRQDLYYRLNVLPLHLPPLRERDDDVLILAEHFVAQTAARYGCRAPILSTPARAVLRAYDWPGNVRELRHVIERTVLVDAPDVLEAGHLPLVAKNHAAANSQVSAPRGDEVDTLANNERKLIARALADSFNNVSEAARRLGLSRGALRYRLEKYGLKQD